MVEVGHPPKALVGILNRVLSFLVRTPLRGPVSRGVLVVRFTGRRSGRRYEVFVSPHLIDGGLTVLTNARWRLNFRGGRPAEWLYQGRTTSGRGILVEEPQAVGELYHERIRELGVKMAGRRTPVKVNVQRVPTVEELAELARTQHLSAVRFS